MGKIRSTIQNFSLRMDSLEKKVFWLLAALTMVSGFVCIALTVFERQSFVAVIAAGVCAVVPLICMFLCDKTGNYNLSYTVLCIAINMVFLPLCLFTNGGIFSGMPVIMAGATILNGFSSKQKLRNIMAAVTLVIDTAVLVISVKNPDLVTPIPDGFVEFDVIACFIFVCIGIFSMITLVMKEYRAAILKEKNLADQKADIRFEMMTAQNENVEAVRRMRHDARHHNAMILELLQNEKYDELKKYMQQKMGDEEQYATVIYCMNSIVNTILSVYTRKAKRAGIETEINADVPAEIGVNEPDMVAMLSNIYENAIHGAQASGKENQKIIISIHPKDSHLVIRCTNTCEDNLELFNGFPGPGPGTGIRSIIESSKSYDGQLMYGIDHGELICRLVISMD